MRYLVTLERVLVAEVEVEADSEQEARGEAWWVSNDDYREWAEVYTSVLSVETEGGS